MKNNLNYLYAFIDEYPKITSGRKNYKDHQKRIVKNISLIKKFIKERT